MARTKIVPSILAALALTALWAVFCGGGEDEPPGTLVPEPTAAADVATLMPAFEAGPVEPDRFHPDHQPGPDGRRPPRPEPALGGSVTVHLSGIPPALNTALSVDANAHFVALAVHESLTLSDWETWETRLDLAHARWLEDELVLHDDAPARAGEQAFERRLRGSADDEPSTERVRVLCGRVEDLGERWRVTPLAPGNPLSAALEVPAAEVREVVHAGAITFELRADVPWQPSPGFERHVFDVDDVLFSLSIYSNPAVHCDERRYQYEKVAHAVRVDDARVRFHLGAYDVWAADDVGEMPILPRHLYDLSDPDCPDHDPEASLERRGAYVNASRFNQEWVGLGPYRVTRYGAGAIEAERFEGYHDPSRAGYLERVRWRAIRDEGTTFQALLEGELDVVARLSAAQFLGDELRRPQVAARVYPAWTSVGSFAYVGWNLHRPPLDELLVRRALNHCLDVQSLFDTYWGGLGVLVSGPAPYHSPAYDRTVAPATYDLGRARELLAQAGWYDRDGDGWVDRDGRRLSLGYASIAGAETSQRVGLMLQESLRAVGVELTIRELDWGTVAQGLRERAYDSFCQGWNPPLEPDPEQQWHSRGGAQDVRSSNYMGVRDAELDALIEAGQREPDHDARMAIWRALHRRIDALAPALFLAAPAQKMALPRALRGIQLFHLSPGYDLTRWYYPVGTP
ncbi:MAG TPA: ABC transporter substrate-binding protein, partial [Planctomycetota bacterium]|nr:ABC transporter substrate-binding protein [Planctomycetota bacterium]